MYQVWYVFWGDCNELDLTVSSIRFFNVCVSTACTTADSLGIPSSQTLTSYVTIKCAPLILCNAAVQSIYLYHTCIILYSVV